MPAQRFYIYRCDATNAWALTGEKEDSRLPAPLATDQWRFWMQISCHQIENGVFAFALKTVATQVAAKGYYLFTHSITPRDARAGPDADTPGGTRQHRTSMGTTAVMSKAHQLFSSASYDPDTLNMLGEVLDEAWASIASHFGNDFRKIEAARIQLATIVLDLARDGQLGQLQITRTAARLMREKHATTKQRS
jgi:hypothetical protein